MQHCTKPSSCVKTVYMQWDLLKFNVLRKVSNSIPCKTAHQWQVSCNSMLLYNTNHLKQQERDDTVSVGTTVSNGPTVLALFTVWSADWKGKTEALYFPLPLHESFLYVPLFVFLDFFGYLPNKHGEVFLTWQKPYPHLSFPRNSLCLCPFIVTQLDYNRRNTLNNTNRKVILQIIIQSKGNSRKYIPTDLNFRFGDSRTNHVLQSTFRRN